MNIRPNLKQLIPFIDQALKCFYDELLSHHQFNVFFRDDAHAHRLISMQKKSFIDSLDDTPEQLRERYIRLGRLHYILRVPSADFLKSTAIWKKSFTRSVLEFSGSVDLVIMLEDYFFHVDKYMAQGFLNEQLAADQQDIKALILKYNEDPMLSTSKALSHLQWLYQILEAISSEDMALVPELNADKCTAHGTFDDFGQGSTPFFSKEHFDDLHQRLHIDARSLFYFIERNDFPEVLSLYANLLSVYKITLIAMGNINLVDTIKHLKRDLEQADEEIKTLRGIIPICSYCHSIRNEKGVWDQMEKYVTEHSEAQFSHGICNECYAKVKGEYGL